MSFTRFFQAVLAFSVFFAMDVAMGATLSNGKASFFATSNAFDMPTNEVPVTGEPKIEAEKLSGHFQVKTGLFETNNDTRDEHMRKKDVLDIAQHSTAEFWLDPMPLNATTFTGQLKVRGVKKAVKGKVEVFGGKSFKFTFDVSCKDFGIDPPSLVAVYMKDKVEVTVTGDVN